MHVPEFILIWRVTRLILLRSVLGWAATGSSVCATYLARQAVRRIDNTRDKRGLMTAQSGVMLGWVGVGLRVGVLHLAD
jgi:hypothetical protein